MKAVDRSTDGLQETLKRGVLTRLPITFLPFVNEQLQKWDFLFPNERKSVQRLLLHVDSLSAEQSTALFRDVVELEEKMGVRHWQFSTSEQTILNASELARSPYFQQWRKAVQAVFDAVDHHTLQSMVSEQKRRNRLVLLDIPQPLPVNKASIWSRWQGIGRQVDLDLGSSESSQGPFESLLAGPQGGQSKGLLETAQARTDPSQSDLWVVDAGKIAVEAALSRASTLASPPGWILLSNERLNQYRESFSHEMNTMHKDLADADSVFDRLRKVDVLPWCPSEVAADPAVREFVRSLYLTGNGAVIFSNSFVEWCASEAMRRARPTFLAAKFGTRAKPKAFTGVAVFDNPDQVNPTPSVDDLPGSALDAEMLALYVWLAALRYTEYQSSTVCVCIAESIAQAYVVAPPEFNLPQGTGPLSLPALRDSLRAWIA